MRLPYDLSGSDGASGIFGLVLRIFLPLSVSKISALGRNSLKEHLNTLVHLEALSMNPAGKIIMITQMELQDNSKS